MSEKQSDAQAIIDAMYDAKMVSSLEHADDEGTSRVVLAVRHGVELRSIKPYLDEYLERPERKEGTARATSIKSFVDLVNRAKTSDTVIFVDDTPGKPSITAVIDYHQSEANGGEAGWRRHRIVYEFPFSPQWLAWRSAKKDLTQLDFATFLEDHIEDVIDPIVIEGSATLERCEQIGIKPASRMALRKLADGLAIRVDQTFAERRNLDNGSISVVFEEQTRGEYGAPLEVPNGFLALIPVFRGDDRYPLPIRLRFRPAKPTIKWSIEPYGIDQAIEDAIARAVERVEKETETLVVCGASEPQA